MTTLDVQESIVKALKFIQFICVCALLLILTLLNKFSSVLFLYIFIHRPLLNTVQLSAFLLSASTAFIVENCSPHQIINPIKDESTPQMNKYKCLLPPWLVRPFHSWIYEPISWDTLKMLVIYMIPHSTEQTLEKSNAYRISRCRFFAPKYDWCGFAMWSERFLAFSCFFDGKKRNWTNSGGMN